MNDIGRTLLSGLAQTICYVHGLKRREITLSQIGFFAELRDKHDVDDASFLVDGAAPLQRAVANTVSISDTNDMEIGTASNISIARQKIELLVSQTVSATPKQQQQTICLRTQSAYLNTTPLTLPTVNICRLIRLSGQFLVKHRYQKPTNCSLLKLA